MTVVSGTAGRRGTPLLMLALLLTAWIGARAVWWENPFARVAEVLGSEVLGTPFANATSLPMTAAGTADLLIAKLQRNAPGLDLARLPTALTTGWATAGLARTRPAGPVDPQFAAAHYQLWRTDFRDAGLRGLGRHAESAGAFGTQRFAGPERPPFEAPASPTDAGAGAGGRWSADGWAFWRQGSDAAPVSQGRVPIYGASQVGAVLQFRIAAAAARDPRLYARAYRALVRRGEHELALGASFRPVGKVPVRVAGEVRLTDAAFTNEVRPSAYAVTELAPVRLAYGAQLEAYGQAGWVGGASATAFADGQASVTREVGVVAKASDNALRLSVGAGAWGGAQDDAQRIDLGPTMRLDLTVGDVPARLSLDWRERVGGQAEPDSGLAATLSARF